MKVSLLLALVCTAILAAGARAEAPGEPAALATKVQEYVQQATEVARSVLATVQESEVAQQARKWLADNAALARQQLAWLKERLSELWKRAPAA
ncbi:apolipoprotein C-III [Apteryx mantelli]|uniref:Apolipoprotein C-III n=1 Tax=Apteryx mantelli TaxID=2696672 RepID=A0ABM4FMP7_9AVES